MNPRRDLFLDGPEPGASFGVRDSPRSKVRTMKKLRDASEARMQEHHEGFNQKEEAYAYGQPLPLSNSGPAATSVVIT